MPSASKMQCIFEDMMDECYHDFEDYMTGSRWDRLNISEEDGMGAVGAFVEFAKTGLVSFGIDEGE